MGYLLVLFSLDQCCCSEDLTASSSSRISNARATQDLAKAMQLEHHVQMNERIEQSVRF